MNLCESHWKQLGSDGDDHIDDHIDLSTKFGDEWHITDDQCDAHKQLLISLSSWSSTKSLNKFRSPEWLLKDQPGGGQQAADATHGEHPKALGQKGGGHGRSMDVVLRGLIGMHNKCIFMLHWPFCKSKLRRNLFWAMQENNVISVYLNWTSWSLRTACKMQLWRSATQHCKTSWLRLWAVRGTPIDKITNHSFDTQFFLNLCEAEKTIQKRGPLRPMWGAQRVDLQGLAMEAFQVEIASPAQTCTQLHQLLIWWFLNSFSARHIYVPSVPPLKPETLSWVACVPSYGPRDRHIGYKALLRPRPFPDRVVRQAHHQSVLKEAQTFIAFVPVNDGKPSCRMLFSLIVTL